MNLFKKITFIAFYKLLDSDFFFFDCINANFNITFIA